MCQAVHGEWPGDGWRAVLSGAHLENKLSTCTASVSVAQSFSNDIESTAVTLPCSVYNFKTTGKLQTTKRGFMRFWVKMRLGRIFFIAQACLLAPTTPKCDISGFISSRNAYRELKRERQYTLRNHFNTAEIKGVWYWYARCLNSLMLLFTWMWGSK